MNYQDNIRTGNLNIINQDYFPPVRSFDWKFFFFLLSIASLGIVIGLIIGNKYNFVNNLSASIQLKPISMNISEYSQCKNLNLSDTADCLYSWEMSFWNYSIPNESIDHNVSYLKQYGGDCQDWNDLYIHSAQSLGYNGNSATICGNITESDNKTVICHVVAILYGNNLTKGYCLMDQTYRPDCRELG